MQTASDLLRRPWIVRNIAPTLQTHVLLMMGQGEGGLENGTLSNHMDLPSKTKKKTIVQSSTAIKLEPPPP